MNRTPGTSRRLRCLVSSAALLTAILPSADAANPAAEKIVYQNDFEKQIEFDIWSHAKTLVSPADGNRFLGEIEWNTTVTARLRELPEHRFIRLRCDLILLKTIDGENTAEDNHRDGFNIWAEGGPLILTASFSNPTKAGVEDPPPERLQSFPDEFPLIRHKAGTGAHKITDLKIEGRARVSDDSIYKLDLVFPHAGADLHLNFDASLTENGSRESWGLDSIEISTIDRASKFDKARLDEHWKALSGKDPVVASRAVWSFVGAGADGAAFIRTRWQAHQEAEAAWAMKRSEEIKKEIAEEIAKLEDDEFKVRKKAEQKLMELGPEVLPLIVENLKAIEEPESRAALGRVRSHLEIAAEAARGATHDALVESRVNHVLRIWDSFSRDYVVTSSIDGKNRDFSNGTAANDGYVPRDSGDFRAPRVDWRPAKGGDEWLQYDFKKVRTFSSAAVFWYFDIRPERAGPPDSWKVAYRNDKGAWIEVVTEDDYEIEPHVFNTIRFKPVKTTALRLLMKSSEAHSPGLLEFRALPDPE